MLASDPVELRPAATMADARRLFEWRNDPFIWSRGSSQRCVAWEEHIAWFEASLSNSQRLLFLIEQGDVPVGMARFDLEGDATCVISAYLAQEHVGRGIGVQAIRLACSAAFGRWPVQEIHAFVRSDNSYGLRGFKKAGFTLRHTMFLEGHATLVLRRGEGRS